MTSIHVVLLNLILTLNIIFIYGPSSLAITRNKLHFANQNYQSESFELEF